MASPLDMVGSTISLITNSDVRYEGTLHSIDLDKSTLTVENGVPVRMCASTTIAFHLTSLRLTHTVRSFGTEDRVPAGGVVIPPSTQTYKFIVFQGAMIKDLSVTARPAAPPLDPAIVSMQAVC